MKEQSTDKLHDEVKAEIERMARDMNVHVIHLSTDAVWNTITWIQQARAAFIAMEQNGESPPWFTFIDLPEDLKTNWQQVVEHSLADYPLLREIAGAGWDVNSAIHTMATALKGPGTAHNFEEARTIVVPFRADMEEAIQDGRKTATTRSKRLGYVGDRFQLLGHTYEITLVEEIRLVEIATSIPRLEAEGFGPTEGETRSLSEAEQAFIQIWNELHRRGRKRYEDDPERLVWYHEFRRIS